MNRNTERKGYIMLLVTAMIWGAAFVAQDVGMDHIGPFAFNAARMILGALTLVPVILVMDGLKKRKDSAVQMFRFTKTEWIGGVLCGVALFAGSSLQQVGIALYNETEAAAGKAGFITSLYIVLVPFSGLLFRKKIGAKTWGSVTIATVGMYLLCVQSGFSVTPADGLLFFCAFAFTVHICVVGVYSNRVNGIKLSAVQFLVAGLLALVCALVFETPTVAGMTAAALPIAYAGILSCAVAYTMQVAAQKHTKSTSASVIMSLESVFAALTGLLFGERLNGRESLGCLLMFCAVLLLQIEFPNKKTKASALEK